MRTTKTLLLVAALTAACELTSMAQVFSVNMVGYVNRTIPSGAHIFVIANQLNNKLGDGSTDNRITTLLPSVPLNTQLYKLQGGVFAAAIYDGTTPFWGPTGVPNQNGAITLNPGEAAYLATTAANPGFTLTFVGEVQLNSTTTIPGGFKFSLVSSVIPQKCYLFVPPGVTPSDLDPTALNDNAGVNYGQPPNFNEQYFVYPGATSDPFNAFAWDANLHNWGNLPSGHLNPGPIVDVANGFLFGGATGSPDHSWTRTFSVGP